MEDWNLGMMGLNVFYRFLKRLVPIEDPIFHVTMKKGSVC
jgi:hypothetical protein